MGRPSLTVWHGVVVVLIGGVCVARPGVAAEGPSWPQFHGPNRDNISTETGLLRKWPDGGPKLLWTTKGLGHGYSSVSISGGRIFTAGNIDDQTVITAMDREGRIQWQVKCGPAWEKPYGGSRGTPTIDGGRLYYENPHGDVVCLEAATGKKQWGLNILDVFHSKTTRWGLAESLLIDGDRLICSPCGPEVSLVALDKNSGKLVWKARSTGHLASYASPILVDYQGLRIIITLTARSMIGVNADIGNLLWQVKHVSLFDENILQPVYRDGCVYVSSLATGTVKWKIEVDGEKATVNEAWRCREMDNHHGGVILLEGYLYGSTAIYHRGRWICLDAKTGKKMYDVPGVGKGSLTCAEGMLYTLSEKGTVGLVKATPEGHRVVSKFQIPKGGEGPSWAHPVICGGRLYIRHGDFLYAYDVRTGR